MSYADERRPAAAPPPPAAALLKALRAMAPGTFHVLDGQLRERPEGQPFTADLCGPDDADRTRDRLREALEGPEPVRDHGFRDGKGRTFTLTAQRVDDIGDGSPGLLVAVTDVTERDRTLRRESVAADVRATVGRHLDTTLTCRDLVEALVPGYADLAVVEVVEDMLFGSEPVPALPAEDLTLRCAATRVAASPGDEGARSRAEATSVPGGGVRKVPLRTPQARALSDLEPRLVDLTGEGPGRETPDMWPPGAHSLIVAPLAVHGAVLGLLSVYRRHRSEPFQGTDVATVAHVATHAALSLDNARRFERDHTLASVTQHRLLPHGPTSTPGLEATHVYIPGSNSGCWYDTIALPGARTALVVGEVVGQGITTAAAMGQLRMVINALADLDLEPDELLARLDDTTTRLAAERSALPAADTVRSAPVKVSCLYGVYDPFTRTCALACAGDLVPFVVRPDGSTFLPVLPEAPALGTSESVPFAAAEVSLEEGGLLALRTGAFAAPDAHEADPVRRALAAPSRPLRELSDAAVYALPDGREGSGAVLLLARTGALEAGCVVTMEVPFDHGGPAAARASARAQLAAWRVSDELVEAGELLVSELVTNAVRHGAPPVTLRLIHTETVTYEVHDAGAAAPHLRHARTVDESGRGLFIVSHIAQRWGTRYDTAGKTLWAEQRLTD